MRFLGLGLEERVPDATTLWCFRERLEALGLVKRLFNRFDDYLVSQGLEARSGQIIDATIVRAPAQHNSREENALIKQGEVPQAWSKPKRRQKDVDARWTKKHGKSHYGYKNHISVDARHKLVRDYEVSAANLHDSQAFEEVLDPDNLDPEVWGEGAYRSKEIEGMLEGAGYESHICERGQAGQPLDAEQQGRNHERSKIRSRVEHVFGFQEKSMGGQLVRTIGLARACIKIGMMNLTYNLMRYLQIDKYRTAVPTAA